MARQAGRNSRDKDLDVRILSETRYILHFALHCIIPAIVATLAFTKTGISATWR